MSLQSSVSEWGLLYATIHPVLYYKITFSLSMCNHVVMRTPPQEIIVVITMICYNFLVLEKGPQSVSFIERFFILCPLFRVSMIGGSGCVMLVHLSVQEAEVLALKDKLRLLKTRKLTLVVDLDQTLIHTSTDPHIEPGLPVSPIHLFCVVG